MNATRLLAYVAAGAILVAVTCLSGAYALVNAKDSGSTELVSRELPWDGSTALSFDVAVVARYVQSTGPGRIVARGPHRSVSTLMVTNGHIHDQLLHTGATLDIEIEAPTVKSFYLNGRSRLRIESYDQDTLTLITDGSAAISAAGSVATASVTMQGAGAIELSKLNADTVIATLDGASTLVSAPARTAKLVVRDFATAVLLTRPNDLVTKLQNSGRVIESIPTQ